MAEEVKPEAVAAGEKKITDIQGTIDGNAQSNVTTVKPLASDTGEGYDSILKTAFSFGVPDNITGGDTFEVKVSDNVNLHGISKDSVIDDLYYNGELLAEAEVQPDGRTIIYRFTDYVDKIANIKMNISFPLFIDKVNVPENSTQNVVVTVDGNQFSKTFNVDYSRADYYKSEEEDVETLSGKANLDTVTDTTYHHTIYVNTNNQELTNSKLRIRNQDGTDGAIFDQDVVDSFKVYRLNDGAQLKGSFNLNYADLTEVTENATIRKALNEKMGILVDINQKNDKASYVVVYDGKRKENTSLDTIVEFAAASKKRIDGTPEGSVTFADKNWSWKNDVYFDNGDAEATGDEKPEVYKLGDKVWIDENGNGIQDPGEKPLKDVYVSIVVNGQETILRTDENGNYLFNNLPNGEYEVTFANLQGYKPTKAKQGADDAVDSDATLVDGVLKTTAKIQDADNMNVDLGLIKEKTYTLGDRVWLDDNKDGLQTEGEKGVEGVTVKLTGGDLTEAKTTKTDANGNYKFEGLKNGEYTVTFETPEGYDITKTNIGEDEEKDSDGLEVTATIKDADNMSVDLGLVKKEAPAEKTYTLGDRVWLDDNKDGLQTEGEKGVEGVTVKLTGGDLTEAKTTKTDANGNYKFEGLKNGEYTVTFETPEGYDITKTNIGEDEEKDSDGLEVTATIKDADNMSVDLGLVKKEAPVEKTYTLGDRVWLDDNKDGLQTEGEKGVEGVTVKLTGGDLTEAKTTKTDANGNYKFEGLKNGEYTVTFETPEGYDITKTNIGEDDEKDSDGLEVKATIKDADNMSVDLGLVKKEAPAEETGKFVEHHIYITKDESGKEISRKSEDGKVQEGKKEETYTTGKKEKDGFEFVRTENPVEDPSYNEKGETTTGNYKPGVTQEITYVYERTETPLTPIEPSEPVVEEGSFQEHHIYISKDKDGKEISRKEVPGDLQKGKEDDSYTTGKKEKDGFKFVRTENPVENPTFDENGKTTNGKYRPGVKQEITYVYERTETPLTPIEPSEPVEPETPWTPLEPSEPVEPGTPWTPLEPSEPVEKDTPWTPLEPSEPVEPGTSWTPLEPSEPVEPSTPEEPEKPTNPEKPVSPVKPQNPESQGTTNNPTKTMETIKTHGSIKQASKNPKTGLGSSVGIAGIAISSILASIGVEKKKKEDK